MTVTDVRTTKRGRKSIYLDGEFAFALHPDAAAEFELYKGEEVDDNCVSAALARSREIEAAQKALRLLSQRSYTSGKLKEKLAVHGEEAAEAATKRMEELRLVDDNDYARRYAEQLYNNKYMSPRRIRHALVERGVPGDIAYEAAQSFDKEHNSARAACYLERKYPNLDDERIKNRAGAALGRLGYTTAEIIEAFGMAGCGEDEY